jgi:hypothetical protein
MKIYHLATLVPRTVVTLVPTYISFNSHKIGSWLCFNQTKVVDHYIRATVWSLEMPGTSLSSLVSNIFKIPQSTISAGIHVSKKMMLFL